MTSDRHLYRGTIENHFVDKDGELRGLLLKNAKRFKYAQLEADRKFGKDMPTERYWKEIPGSNLYIPFEKTVTLNLRYELPDRDLRDRLQAAIQRLTGIPNIVLEPPSTAAEEEQEPNA